MKIALVQLNATDQQDQNIKKAVRLVKRAIKNKAEFILLPEFFAYRGGNQRKKAQGALIKTTKEYTGLPLKQLEPFCDLAHKHKVFILAGSVYETISSKAKGYNTSVLIDDQGKIQGTYRKQNLFDALIDGKRVKEEQFFQKGKEVCLKEVKGFLVGLTICYDLRFPELYQKYAQLGAEIICVPSSFSKKTGQAHWETLLRARAIENTCFIVAPNQIGKLRQGVPCYGNSMIVDPWGTVLGRASGTKEEIVYAKIEKQELQKARIILPGFRKN